MASATDHPVSLPSPTLHTAKDPRPVRKKRRGATNPTPPPSKKGEAYVHIPATSSPVKELAPDGANTIPTLPSTLMVQGQDSTGHGQRVWQLAQRCQSLQFSGRTLRRLPVLGLAMYTWGGEVGMNEAIGALEQAVAEEIQAMKDRA